MSKKFTNMILFLCMSAFFLILVNFISFRHYKSIDLTNSKQFSLSQESKSVVAALTKEYEILVYFKNNHEIFDHLKKITGAYEEFSDKIKVTFVDPYHDYDKLAINAEIKKEFRVNSILIKNSGKHKILLIDDLAEYDRSLEQYGIKPELKKVYAESAVSASLLSLENIRDINVAILFDHGEKSPNNDNNDGISDLCRELRNEGFVFKLVNLKRIEKIADDTDILLSVSPRVDFTNDDLKKIADWLETGKSFFLTLDPYISSTDSAMLDFNLQPLLDLWGVRLEDTIVVDPAKQVPYSRPDHILVDYYARHIITRGLKGIPTVFFQTRSLKNIPDIPADIKLTPLMVSSEHSWGETDYKNPAYSFDPQSDSKGPCILGMAIDNNRSQGKVLLFSDSDFLCNKQFGNPGNNILVKRCFNWLSEREKSLSIKARENIKVSLRLSRKKQLFIFFAGVILPPLLIVILAFMLRRKRFSKINNFK